jgi:hypothetical protein
MRYDRALLLGVRRDAVLQLWEVHRYGLDSYRDADYVSLYGMPPRQWHSRGVRIVGRTAVECTRDALAQRMARDIAIAARRREQAAPAPIIIDPFAGSANTLYWIMRSLPGSSGAGFEIDQQVYSLTRVNLRLVSASIEYAHIDYAEGIAEFDLPSDRPVICFVAPPWGDALDPGIGLDLAATAPPVAEVIDRVTDRFANSSLLFAIQIHEHTTAASLAALVTRFDSVDRRDYCLTASGTNHGVVLGTKRWTL